jgi:hypothetical protein
MTKLFKHIITACIICLITLLHTSHLLAANITLSWNAPTTNADGTTLTDLSGYKIYYGMESYFYSDSVTVGNVTTYQLANLTEGQTYYFTVTAIDTSGNESGYSNQSSALISLPSPDHAPEIDITDSVTPVDDLKIPFGDITEFNSTDKTVTINNKGNADLVVANIIKSGSVTTPFTIHNNNCSMQSIVPSDTCSFIVRFSPTTNNSFTDAINITSNDADEATITVAVSGTGLSSNFNNPPSEPELVSPKNKGKANGSDKGNKTGFKWKKSSDPDGDTITYELTVCEDPDLTTGCITETNVASAAIPGIYYAGINSVSTGFLLFGIVFTMPFNRKKRNRGHLIIVTIAMAGMLFLVSCGRNGGVGEGVTSSNGSVQLDEVSQMVSGLNSGNTYYWQVVANDGKGGESYSPIWTFETE